MVYFLLPKQIRLGQIAVKNSAFSPEISALIKKTPHAVNLEKQLSTVTHFAELIVRPVSYHLR